MFHKTAIKHSSPQLPSNSSLQNMVVDLAPEHEAAVSGGNVFFLILFAQSSHKLESKVVT
ncbi:hypothetical protein ACN4EK_00475 [Pantanalinema rosaneae CENA516]|uniref:hypothetical protein n=1 Tax=Pantanalinema rosaneae TaxID=1620701 RepID=UPI003D6DCCB0